MIKDISRVPDSHKDPHILASWHCPDPSMPGVYPGRIWEVSSETPYSPSPALPTTDFNLIGTRSLGLWVLTRLERILSELSKSRCPSWLRGKASGQRQPVQMGLKGAEEREVEPEEVRSHGRTSSERTKE